MRNENGTGGLSPGSSAKRPSATHRSKSIDWRSSRGGVPVFNRPHVNPNDFSDSARSRDGGSFARPAGRCSRPDVNEAVQKRAGRHDERPALDTRAVFQRQSRDTPVLDEDPPGPAEDPPMLGSAWSASRIHSAVSPFVSLRARRPYRRAAAAIEHLELDAGRVDRAPHQSAERVDLGNEVPLRCSANRRIARHVSDCVGGQRADGHVAAEARSGVCGLAPGMPGADRRSRRISQPLSELFSDTKSARRLPQQIIGRSLAGDFLEGGARLVKIRQHKLFRHRSLGRVERFTRPKRRGARSRSAACLTLVTAAVSRSVRGSVAFERRPNAAAQLVHPFTGFRRHDPHRQGDVRRSPLRRQVRLVRRR